MLLSLVASLLGVIAFFCVKTYDAFIDMGKTVNKEIEIRAIITGRVDAIDDRVHDLSEWAKRHSDRLPEEQKFTP